MCLVVAGSKNSIKFWQNRDELDFYDVHEAIQRNLDGTFF